MHTPLSFLHKSITALQNYSSIALRARFLKFATSNPHKNIIFCIFLLFVSSLATAQCPPDSNLYFSQQAHIDSFAAQYPNCTEVKGDLWIGGLFADGLTDLSGLSNITTVGKNVYLHINFKLESLAGLENLTTIKGGLLSIWDCNKLKSLEGLGGIDSLRYLAISRNKELKTLKGLDSLKYAETVDIYNNAELENIEGLHNLEYVAETLSISSNPWLQNIEALSKIKGHENLTFSISDSYVMTSVEYH